MKNSVVGKTILKMLLAVIALFFVFVAVMTFAFPGQMAAFSESVSWYTAACRFSSLKYMYFKDVEDLDRCFEDAVLSGKNSYILEYSEKLISHDDFDALCIETDKYYASLEYSSYTSSYKQYVYGQYVIALAVSGEKQKAADEAFGVCYDFYSGCALSSLAIYAFEDEELAHFVLEAMDKISPSDEWSAYYNGIYNILSAE